MPDPVVETAAPESVPGDGGEGTSLAEWANSEPAAKPGEGKKPETPLGDGRDEKGRFTKPAGKPDEKAPEKKPEPKKETPAEKRYKLKLRGQEREVDEATLLRLAQRADGSDARFEEAAKARKESEALLSKLKADPAAALKQLGLDPKGYFEQWLYENVIQAETLTPEQRRIRELEQQARDKESKEKEMAEQAELRETEQAMEGIREEMQTEMLQAMEKTGLPKHPVALALVANILEAKYSRDDLDYSAEDAAAEVADLLEEVSRARVLGMKPEEFVKYAPKEWLDALRKYDLEQARLTPRKPAPRVASVPRKPAPETLTEKEARDSLHAWAEGG